jgi:Rrf2 family transcriptional regulator, iron-sulfur cluster assembly transcription factor
MTPYGKTAQTAIAAVSRLAEVHDTTKRVKLNSADIAEKRKLPQPVVAKVLTILSQAGIVNGSPGPGGGYWLARDPSAISLYDVVCHFERLDQNVSCPFGPDYCGTGPHCPLHFDMLKIRDQMIAFLKTSTFERFTGWQAPHDAKGAAKGEAKLDGKTNPKTGRALDILPTR